MSKLFKCPSCGIVSEDHKWDGATMGNCTNRQLRRAYSPIAKRKPKKWYTCPNCGINIRIAVIKEVRDND